MHPWKRSCYFTLSLFLWLLQGLGSAVAATPWPELIADLSAPRLGAVVHLTGPLEIGRAKLVPAQGTVVRQLMAGQVVCGLWIDGPTRLTYTVDDPFSLPVARRNLAKALSFNGGKAIPMTFIRELDDALLWSWGFGDLGGVSDADDSGPDSGRSGPAALPEWAGKVLDNPFFEEPVVALMAATDNNPDFVYGLMKSDQQIFLLRYDPRLEREERLSWVRRYDQRKDDDHHRYYRLSLINQPIGRPWWERGMVAPTTTVHLDLKVENPTAERVLTDSTVRITAQRSTRVWVASLMADVEEKGRRRPYQVQSLEVDGQPADYLHRNGRLLVALEPPLGPGQSREIRVQAAGDLAIRYGGDNFWSLGTWAWYPMGDLGSELTTTEISVHVPLPLMPFASGRVVERHEQESGQRLLTTLDRPTMFPVIAAGKYSLFEETQDGKTCRVASYGIAKPKASRKLTQLFFHTTKYYESLFGMPYPFPDMTVIERNSFGFGIAPPGIIFITNEAFQPLQSDIGQLFSGGINERFAHEVAHAWWGHIIKWPSAEEQWLSESFAEYSAAMCLQALHGGKRGQAEFNKLLNGWRARSKQIGPQASIYLANFLSFDADSDDWTRRYLLYNRGPLVLHALGLELRRQQGSDKDGDRYFIALLRSMLKNFGDSWGETRHLVGILNQMTGSDWQPWFERYVYGTEVPKLK